MLHGVISGLPAFDKEGLPDDLTEICASVLNQYIIEDGILKDDKEDRRLEKLMRFCEMYFVYYMQVVTLKEQSDTDGVRAWQSRSNAMFTNHARVYQSLYSQVAHMSGAPYFMTNWSICFLVHSALSVCGVANATQFNALSQAARDELEYVLRFGENVLQSFYSKAIVG